MNHQTVIHPADHAVYAPTKMGRAPCSNRPALVGLNALRAGQEHALHAHAGQEGYLVAEGSGVFLLDGASCR
jgi:hypothetical protein